MRFPREVVEIDTTYVGDGLGSVVRAANDLRLGSSSANAYLPSEPGGTWLFFGGANEEVYLQVVTFADTTSASRRWRNGSLRWHGMVGVEDFIRNVVLMADDVLAQCGGSDAYLRKWGDIPFPSRGLGTLRT